MSILNLVLSLCCSNCSEKMYRLKNMNVSGEIISQSWPVFLAVFVPLLLYIYYVKQVMKKPAIYSGNRKWRNLLLDYCPTLAATYQPPILWNKHFQTLLRPLLCRMAWSITYEREILILSDGGQVALDWTRPNSSDNLPTVIILPGLTGSSQDTYVQRLVLQVSASGFRAVVFNNRGNGIPLLTPRIYCAANTDDLREVILHVQKRFPDAPLVAAGVSLGGLILSNYLVAYGNVTHLCAAFTVSVAWDLKVSAQSLEQFVNRTLYNRHLCSNLINLLDKYQDMFSEDYDLDQIRQSTTIREFDDRFVAPQFGYSGWKEYYSAATVVQRIPQIRIPLLALNAADDPFAPLYTLPTEPASKSQFLALCVSQHGGHIGFLKGAIPFGLTLMESIFKEYVQFVFCKKEEIEEAMKS